MIDALFYHGVDCTLGKRRIGLHYFLRFFYSNTTLISLWQRGGGVKLVWQIAYCAHPTVVRQHPLLFTPVWLIICKKPCPVICFAQSAASIWWSRDLAERFSIWSNLFFHSSIELCWHICARPLAEDCKSL